MDSYELLSTVSRKISFTEWKCFGSFSIKALLSKWLCPANSENAVNMKILYFLAVSFVQENEGLHWGHLRMSQKTLVAVSYEDYENTLHNNWSTNSFCCFSSCVLCTTYWSRKQRSSLLKGDLSTSTILKVPKVTWGFVHQRRIKDNEESTTPEHRSLVHLALIPRLGHMTRSYSHKVCWQGAGELMWLKGSWVYPWQFRFVTQLQRESQADYIWTMAGYIQNLGFTSGFDNFLAPPDGEICNLRFVEHVGILVCTVWCVSHDLKWCWVMSKGGSIMWAEVRREMFINLILRPMIQNFYLLCF